MKQKPYTGQRLQQDKSVIEGWADNYCTDIDDPKIRLRVFFFFFNRFFIRVEQTRLIDKWLRPDEHFGAGSGFSVIFSFCYWERYDRVCIAEQQSAQLWSMYGWVENVAADLATNLSPDLFRSNSRLAMAYAPGKITLHMDSTKCFLWWRRLFVV